MKYCSAIKNEILPLVIILMDLQLMLSDVRDKYCMISFICGILKK